MPLSLCGSSLGIGLATPSAMPIDLRESDVTPLKVSVTFILWITFDVIQASYETERFRTKSVIFDSDSVLLGACAVGDVDMVLGAYLTT